VGTKPVAPDPDLPDGSDIPDDEIVDDDPTEPLDYRGDPSSIKPGGS